MVLTFFDKNESPISAGEIDKNESPIDECDLLGFNLSPIPQKLEIYLLLFDNILAMCRYYIKTELYSESPKLVTLLQTVNTFYNLENFENV